MDARITRGEQTSEFDPSRGLWHEYESVNAAGVLVPRREPRKVQSYTADMHVAMAGPPSTYVPPKEK
jgi:hypothetical protein